MNSASGNWRLAQHRSRIAPSILSADLARLGEEVAKVGRGGVEILHFDVMDGHFVPNISFGVPVMATLRKVSRLFFDTHLMITDPLKYAEPFVKAGADSLTFHIEACPEPLQVIEHIRSLGVNVGVSLNPGTEAAALGPIIGAVDLVLVMSVWPGFGGQSFIETSLDKLRELRGMLRPDQRLEVDGGIDATTIAAAAAAGADTLAAGSAVFGQPDPGAACLELARVAREAAGGR